MTDYYTSLETSVALRDAGAPRARGSAEVLHCVRCKRRLPRKDADSWCGWALHDCAVAFRADEVIEALGPRFVALRRSNRDRVVFVGEIRSRSGKTVHFFESDVSPVEALAVAWLAVLKEAKRGRAHTGA